MIYKEKPCKICKAAFQPTAPSHLYCSDCKVVAQAKEVEIRRVKAYDRWCNKQIALGREDVIGVGKGGSNLKGEAHPQYKTGVSNFHRAKKRYPDTVRYCNRCDKDLKHVDPHCRCVHHIDHDRDNNHDSNFEYLCKSCHQIEHEAHKNFL